MRGAALLVFTATLLLCFAGGIALDWVLEEGTTIFALAFFLGPVAALLAASASRAWGRRGG